MNAPDRRMSEGAFWDMAAAAAMRVLIPFGVTGQVDDYGPKEVASDAANFATALLVERRRRVEAKSEGEQ
jgi:hypothetical protein